MKGFDMSLALSSVHIWTKFAKAFILLCFFVVNVSVGFAIDVTQVSHHTNGIRPKISFMRDPGNTLKIADIVKLRNENKFDDLKDVTSLGYSNDGIWMEFQLHNTSNLREDLFVEISYPIIDYVDFYVVGEDGKIEREHLVGQSRYREPQFNLYPNPNMPFSLEPQSSKSIYVKIKSLTTLNTSVLIWSKDVFIVKTIHDRIFYGLFYGGMLALIIYNLFLAFSTRDKVYFIYVAFLTVNSLFYAAWNGLGNVYLWANFPSTSASWLPTMWAACIALGVEFCIGFLDLRKHLPKWVKPLKVMSTIAFAISLIAFFFPETRPARLIAATMLPVVITVMTAGFILSRRGVRQARIYLVGWSIFLVASTYATLGVVGIVPFMEFTRFVPQAGNFFEVLVFSIGLGDKINAEKKARHIAQREMIESLSKVNKNLEELVEKGKSITSQSSLKGLDAELKSAIAHTVGDGCDASVRFAKDCFVDESIKPGFYEIDAQGSAKAVATETNEDTPWLLTDPRHNVALAKVYLSNKTLNEQAEQRLKSFMLHASSALSTVRLQKSLDLLDARTQEMRGVFNLIKQGIFTLNAELNIKGDYSPALEDILGRKTLTGQNFIDIMRSHAKLNQEDLDRLYSVLAMGVGYDVILFDTQKNLLPKEFVYTLEGSEKILEADWLPILASDGDTIDRYLVTLRDVTSVRALQMESDKARDSLKLIGEVIECGPQGFAQFVEGSAHALQKIQNACKGGVCDVKKVKDVLHSMKGDARTRGLNTFSTVIHDVETSIAELLSNEEVENPEIQIRAILNRVPDALEQYRQTAYDKLHMKSGGDDLMLKTVEAHLLTLTSHKRGETLSSALQESALQLANNAGINCLARICSDMNRYLNKVKDKKGVLVNLFVTDAQDGIFSAEAYKVLETSFTHLLTNSLDHGLGGKAGTIYFASEFANGRLKLRFSDSGKGLNLGRILSKAQELKLVPAGATPTDDEIAAFIFASEFSTAGEVTETSGRGVGMSAVRQGIVELGGSISIQWKAPQINGFRTFEFVIDVPVSGASIPFLYPVSNDSAKRQSA